MEEYDLIVVGSGAGMNVASKALQAGKRVAVVEHGLLGGTCLNTGCIPSKILIYPADLIRELGEAQAIGV
ncbi:MAG: FAD-dependent oxidoreductase, partial [Anaerolineae bacterium]|nr:FAD-dependent oxidoreductase [Anaerolineae bacterium]